MPHPARLATALILAAGLAWAGAPLSLLAQTAPQQQPGPPGGAPEVQAPAPEVGPGRGGVGSGQVPDTTVPGARAPVQSPPTQATAPTPTTAAPAPVPFTARDVPDAAELELQRALRGGVIEGRVTIPNQAAGILIQPQGRDWRQFRTRWLTIAGVIALAGTIAALALFYVLRGRARIESGRSGRHVARYTLFERANHWMIAFSFVILALTGLNITYGVYVLRPLIGAEAFTALTLWGQVAHHFVAFAFMLGVLVMLVHWARANLPRRVDIAWIRAGGPLAKGHPPAGKFNAGQKLLYWFSMLAGVLLAVSGILLLMPSLLDDVTQQQWAHVSHGVLAMLMIAVILGHIYLGTIGTEGAFEGMRDGDVDFNYAREHHGKWLEDELVRARREVAPNASPPAHAAGAD
jgi:formate dehydrogenase subunit gamma